MNPDPSHTPNPAPIRSWHTRTPPLPYPLQLDPIRSGTMVRRDGKVWFRNGKDRIGSRRMLEPKPLTS